MTYPATSVAVAEPATSKTLAGDRALLAALLVGPLIASVYNTMVSLALPEIGVRFTADLPLVQWVVLIYLLVNSATLMAAGRLGDLFGAARVYRWGLAVFAIGGLVCAAAPSLGALLAARTIQALGASLFVGVAPAILTAAFPAQRGRVFGLSATTTFAGLALGPLLGGVLSEWLGWRGVFVATTPLAALALGLAWRWVPLGSTPGVAARFDWWGSLSYAATLGPLLVALTQVQAWGLTSPAVLGLLGLSVVAAVAFVQAERRTVAPVVDLALFGSRYFAVTALAKSGLFMAMFPTFFILMPFYLSQVRGLSPGTVGLILGVQFVAMSLAGPLAGWLCDRIGTRWPAAGGMALMAACLVTLAQIGPAAPYAVIIALLAAFGTGGSLAEVGNTTALMGAVPAARRGMAAATVGTTRFLGQALGVALAGAVFALAGGTATGAGEWPPYGTTFLALSSVAAATALLTLAQGPPAPAPARF